jgi:hypothetical protein
MSPDLDADQLLATAQERVGLDDFGPGTFREGLDRLVDGLNDEARLNDLGRAIAPEGLLSQLMNRLQVVDWHRRHPEIAAADVTPPVVMIGMGRTGTTILHDLLGQDPANRIPRTWEVDQPCPPPEAATYETDPRIAESQARIDLAYEARPVMRSMHPMGARLGQECIVFMGSEFKSGIFLSQYNLPSYMHWLNHEADMAPAYRWHRGFLQLLQSRHPGERWVLKSGAHLWALPALMTEYPNAVLVQTHRDPRRIIASLTSLFAVVHATASDGLTIAGVASEWADPVLDALDRSVTAREDGTIAPDRVLDVQYTEFLSDPIATIRAIYDHLGADLTPAVEDSMRAFFADNDAQKFGRHGYMWADTGLDADEIMEKAKRYCDYFDVTPEPLP